MPHARNCRSRKARIDHDRAVDLAAGAHARGGRIETHAAAAQAGGQAEGGAQAGAQAQAGAVAGGGRTVAACHRGAGTDAGSARAPGATHSRGTARSAADAGHRGAGGRAEDLHARSSSPTYPTLSRRRGETGAVSIYFEVSVGGQIEKAHVTKSSGYPRLDEAALDAINASSCKPYIENGQPVRARYTQVMKFNLDGE